MPGSGIGKDRDEGKQGDMKRKMKRKGGRVQAQAGQENQRRKGAGKRTHTWVREGT